MRGERWRGRAGGAGGGGAGGCRQSRFIWLSWDRTVGRVQQAGSSQVIGDAGRDASGCRRTVRQIGVGSVQNKT